MGKGRAGGFHHRSRLPHQGGSCTCLSGRLFLRSSRASRRAGTCPRVPAVGLPRGSPGVGVRRSRPRRTPLVSPSRPRLPDGICLAPGTIGSLLPRAGGQARGVVDLALRQSDIRLWAARTNSAGRVHRSRLSEAARLAARGGLVSPHLRRLHPRGDKNEGVRPPRRAGGLPFVWVLPSSLL